MAVPNRSELHPGLPVAIVQKQDQRSGQLTEGVIQSLLTKSPSHPHGIKVRLDSGEVGRVQAILE
ncbi:MULTISPECIES: YwbE family protein [Corallincola]|uniref:YwbE family protein n=3 Tax=Corallincola TaxID=1775176 RepID=A0A368NQN3_9GAMM|nr:MULTISPECIES: YwbE family protein [Corallincola]RCU52877.1 YwbE family protein [Corallincola holothuriorum]TAA47971.1 YwbE family protein [Corallincola spongiicola]TCI03375.1 YwbE family protein [Corallincola luteus]